MNSTAKTFYINVTNSAPIFTQPLMD